MGLAKRDPLGILSGARVLVVEDDFLIRMELEDVLSEAGATVVGSCATLKAALALTASEGLGVAILDLQLLRESALAVAQDLNERGIPFIFYTGQVDLESIQARWPRCKILQKPASAKVLVAAVAGALSDIAIEPSKHVD